MKNTEQKTDVYQKINEAIVRLLESGATFSKPFKQKNSAAAQNFIGKTPYTGRNFFLMNMIAQFYGCPYFVTFKQAQELGGNVKKGEKAWPVVFFKMLEKESKKKPDEKDRIPFARWSNVFNLAQCEGIDIPQAADEALQVITFNPIEECELIVSGMPKRPEITHVENSGAFYRPSTDSIQMPLKESFIGVPEYYATLFHELGHSTGHESRVDRETMQQVAAFGSETYGREELVAELCSAYLCGHAGIENNTLASSAGYIAGWRKVIKDDPKAVFWAMKQAEVAAKFILNVKDEEKTKEAA